MAIRQTPPPTPDWIVDTPQYQQRQHTPHTPRPVHGDYDAYGPNTYGSRARKTIPMPYQPPMDEEIEIQIRGACGACAGKGTMPGREFTCRVCRRRYSEQQMRTFPHHGFRGRRVMLPCAHEVMVEDIIWTRPQCMFCEGDGRLYRYVRWGEFVREMYGDEELDEPTTAALKALSQRAAYQQQQRPQQQQQPHPAYYDRFNQSGQPTAPPPHIPAHPSAGPAVGRVTPNLNPVSPHLPPFSPDGEESF